MFADEEGFMDLAAFFISFSIFTHNLDNTSVVETYLTQLENDTE
jgi:hypothetical protein